MPSYKDIQIAVANLLICAYYPQNPADFVYIIKWAILREAAQLSDINLLLRNSTIATQLFKFGLLCYSSSKEALETFYRFLALPFLGESSAVSSEYIYEIVSKAGRLYFNCIAVELFRADFIASFTSALTSEYAASIVKKVMTPPEKIPETLPVMWEQIKVDLIATYAAIPDPKSTLITPIIVMINGETYKLAVEDESSLLHRKTSSSDAKGPAVVFERKLSRREGGVLDSEITKRMQKMITDFDGSTSSDAGTDADEGKKGQLTP